MFNIIKATSESIKDGRTQQDVVLKATEELGELSVEVSIGSGKTYKKAGKDGIIGEAVDLIICSFDIIYQANPKITESEVEAIVIKKLEKWKKSKENFYGELEQT